MPRRIYTYEPGRGWDIWNLIVTIGVFFPGGGRVGFRWQPALVVLRGVRLAGSDPWDAWTLEWSTTSPPPTYNFAVDPRGQQPPAAVGSRSTRKIPIGSTSRGNLMSAQPLTMPDANIAMGPSRRGAASGMYCLIAAESAIFTIFVVAYIFLHRQEPDGPQPQGCPACSNLLHDLFALQQSHHTSL